MREALEAAWQRAKQALEDGRARARADVASAEERAARAQTQQQRRAALADGARAKERLEEAQRRSAPPAPEALPPEALVVPLYFTSAAHLLDYLCALESECAQAVSDIAEAHRQLPQLQTQLAREREAIDARVGALETRLVAAERRHEALSSTLATGPRALPHSAASASEREGQVPSDDSEMPFATPSADADLLAVQARTWVCVPLTIAHNWIEITRVMNALLRCAG